LKALGFSSSRSMMFTRCAPSVRDGGYAPRLADGSKRAV
jgi:hypothetical protein